MRPDRTPCIVGIGTTDFGALFRTADPERNTYDLALDAFYDALEDCGLEKREIDSVICGSIPSYLRFCADAGLHELRYVNYQSAGGNQSGAALLQAATLIQSGQADVIACVYGNNYRSRTFSFGGIAIPTSRYDDPYGMTSNGGYYGMLFRRHQLVYGTPIEALAEVSIAHRDNAAANPKAVMRKPLTLEDYYASPMIVDPFRRLDHCPVVDGGVAYLVTTLERARDLKQVPVQVLSSGVSAAMEYYYGSDDIWYGVLADLRDRLFGRAGLQPKDVDTAQIYDNFTAAVVFALEGMGICERGGAGDWLLAGNHKRGGLLPINTAGGHLSEAYMQGWALTCEAVRQLRGTAALQVENCKVALDVTASPVCSAHLLVV
jgi:acetyl-CoA acetyltransferase